MLGATAPDSELLGLWSTRGCLALADQLLPASCRYPSSTGRNFDEASGAAARWDALLLPLALVPLAPHLFLTLCLCPTSPHPASAAAARHRIAAAGGQVSGGHARRLAAGPGGHDLAPHQQRGGKQVGERQGGCAGQGMCVCQ